MIQPVKKMRPAVRCLAHCLAFCLLFMTCMHASAAESIGKDAVSKIISQALEEAMKKSPSEFQGWAGLEVIKLDAQILRSRGHRDLAGQIVVADITGDQRDEIILVHRRQSRLEIYSWLAEADRQPLEVSERPNDIQLPHHIQQREIQLDELPLQVVVMNAHTMAVLSGPPYKLIILQRQTDAPNAPNAPVASRAEWTVSYELKLLPAVPTAYLPVLLHETKNGAEQSQELLIACDSGVQRIQLAKGAQASWLRPRGKYLPWKWWLRDLDGDGDKDLIKAYAGKKQSLVWHRNDGGFRPEQVIYKKRLRDIEILDRQQAASEVVIIAANGQGLLRRLQLQTSEEKPFARVESLTLPSAKSPWVGIRKGDRRSLVAIDGEHPQLVSYDLSDGTWLQGSHYPCVTDVTTIAAPLSQPGVLLLQRKGAAELFRSDWKNGRFSFPQPWTPTVKKNVVEAAIAAIADKTAGEEKVKKAAGDSQHTLIALGQAADVTWWVQKQGKDLVLYTWDAQHAQPREQRYVGVAGKIEKAQWLGGDKILVQDLYARKPRLIEMHEGTAKEITAAHVTALKFEHIHLLPNQSGQLRPVRMADGVVQWLDDSLQASDQIMLDDGQSISDFLIMENDAYALEQGGKILHKLGVDDGGVLRSIEQYDVPGGRSLVLDPLLGLIIEQNVAISLLAHGASSELQVQESIDDRAIRAKGLKKSTMHRLFAIDIYPAATRQLVVSDDYRHRLSVFNISENGLKGVSSWQIFENTKYPYGESEFEDVESEPRYIESVRFDDDQRNDMLLICHDRLLIYTSASISTSKKK